MNCLICPYANGTPNCLAYNNYSNQVESPKGEDLITKDDEGNYKCSALEKLVIDLKNGKESREAKNRLFYFYRLGGLCCSHIELLNNSKPK